MWTRLLLVAGTGLVLYGIYWVVTNALFLETADYSVVRADGPFEIRDYPELSVVTTPNGDDSAFGRLFRFIQGGNSRREKIAMTTPVFVDRGDRGKRMSFVVPKEIGRQGIPEPANQRVAVEKRPAERVAVFRFSGVADEESNQAALSKLKAWMDKQLLQAEGEAIFAYYDAPFIPGPFRRNEVMLRIKN
jgi:hypothetical protein